MKNIFILTFVFATFTSSAVESIDPRELRSAMISSNGKWTAGEGAKCPNPLIINAKDVSLIEIKLCRFIHLGHQNSIYVSPNHQTTFWKNEKGENVKVPKLILSNLEEVRRFYESINRISAKKEYLIEDV